jgi:D-sedoheptulose 7-phosphate isomerase
MEGSEHSRRYLAATSELAGASDPGQIDEMARGLAAIRSRGRRLFVLGVGGGAGQASHADALSPSACAISA